MYHAIEYPRESATSIVDAAVHRVADRIIVPAAIAAADE